MFIDLVIIICFYIHVDVLDTVRTTVEMVSLSVDYLDPGLRRGYQRISQVMVGIANILEEVYELGIRRSGRPSIEVEQSQLAFFIDTGFKVEEMALMLNCSKRTVEHKLHANGLSRRRNYTAISDWPC